jgi:hypothetical protein
VGDFETGLFFMKVSSVFFSSSGEDFRFFIAKEFFATKRFLSFILHQSYLSQLSSSKMSPFSYDLT